jgi:hypothetical protein
MDRVTRLCLIVGTLALAWMAVRPHLLPASAEAAREIVTVDLERIGGRFLTGGVLPMRCGDARP